MMDRTRESVFYPPSPYKPHGITYSEWSKIWYSWIQFIKREENPAIDITGKNCARNQSGNVWFLAGTIKGSVKRTCIIPEGKDIYFPIINEMSTTAQYNKSGHDLIDYCSRIIDQVTRREVTLDYQKLEDSDLDAYRIQTGLFYMTLPEGNLCGVPAGHTQVICDGYWIMIRKEALFNGKHTLHFLGEQEDGFRTEVTYCLTIE